MNKQQRIQSLSRMTVANGCTEAEAKTASEKLAKMRKDEASDKGSMEKYRKMIAEQERAMKIVAAKAAAAVELAKWDKMLKEWSDELGYSMNVDYRELKKKNWKPL